MKTDSFRTEIRKTRKKTRKRSKKSKGCKDGQEGGLHFLSTADVMPRTMDHNSSQSLAGKSLHAEVLSFMTSRGY